MSRTLCDIEREGETAILTVKTDVGEIAYDRFEGDAQAVFDLLKDNAAKNVVVDFNHADYFGSSVVNLLLRLRSEAIGRGGSIALCRLSAHAKQVLQTLNLEKCWSLCDSRESAMVQVTA